MSARGDAVAGERMELMTRAVLAGAVCWSACVRCRRLIGVDGGREGDVANARAWIFRVGVFVSVCALSSSTAGAVVHRR